MTSKSSKQRTWRYEKDFPPSGAKRNTFLQEVRVLQSEMRRQDTRTSFTLRLDWSTIGTSHIPVAVSPFLPLLFVFVICVCDVGHDLKSVSSDTINLWFLLRSMICSASRGGCIHAVSRAKGRGIPD
jgi:hypothetical protein